MTDNELFNLVAPIAVYHWADIYYGKRASKAWKQISKVLPEVWRQLGLKNPATNCDFSDLDSSADWAIETYNSLFERIISDSFNGNVCFQHDHYGARTVVLSNEVLMSGDTCGYYPWYANAELLIAKTETVPENL